MKFKKFHFFLGIVFMDLGYMEFKTKSKSIGM